MDEVVPLEREYARLVEHAGTTPAPELVELRWDLEELRVATFAQPMVVRRPGRPAVSTKRIAAALAASRR
jgi:hypothetical protein